jgi:hypothetical protein
MVRRWWRRWRGRLVNAWIAGVGVVAGLVYLAVRLAEGAGFFDGFMRAAGIAFVLMVVLATARGVTKEGVEEAEAPGGWRLKFGTARRAVGAVERRLDAHINATDERLLDLERAVFKDGEDG